jgi:ABC-2 type transport system ATP-binding protein
LHEVELVCDRVVVIQKGGIIAAGTIAEITRGGSSYDIAVAEPARAAEVLRRIDGVREVRVTERGLEVNAGPDLGETLNRALVSAQLFAGAIVPRQSSLEDVFLELTEKEADAPPAA